MYCDFFGLRFHPFDDPADTRFFFQTAEGEEALASMEYESHDGGGMALLLGQAGTGKSLLIRMFLQRLRAPDRSVVLTWPASEQPHLIHAAAKGFGITVPASSDPTRCLSRLRGHLSRRVGADLKAILILDQAENLTAENMAQLAALSELQSDSRGLLSILLVGQPQFRNLLDLPETARIRQRVFGDRVLPPLTAAETERYIHHRLRVAGTGETPLFEPDAARAIHEASGGIPRLINRLCNTALLAAYGAGDGRVASALAAEVCGGVPAEPTGNDVAFIDNRPLTIDHPEPRGSHQATTVSAFVEAPGPDPGSTGSDPYGPDQIPSRDAGGKTPADPPAVPDTPLAQPWSHEPHVAASTALDHGGANDAARQSGDGVGLSASGLTRAESLLDRLEKALARAERAGVTTEASLTQHQAVEKHIHTLTT
ncbi:MAG: AAA family ATPase, partial [Phycisphaerae bacterium]